MCNLTSGQVLDIFLHQLSCSDLQGEPIFAWETRAGERGSVWERPWEGRGELPGNCAKSGTCSRLSAISGDSYRPVLPTSQANILGR